MTKSFHTTSHIPIDAYYGREKPGEFPFTRGVYPAMYRERLWTMRQYAGFGTASASNARYRELIASGGTGLSVAFDLPTQMGLDSDDARSLGEVGRAGVAIDSLEDMQELFSGIDLAQISTSMTINATAIILLALTCAVAEKNGVDVKNLSGTIQNDILKEYVARGTYIYPIKPSLRLITDIFAFCQAHVPRFNTISVSGYHIREAGATAVQEVAFTLANGLAYVKAATDAGLDVNDFAPRLTFFFNAHNNFFEEIAKFRAARRLWARLMRERYRASDRCAQLKFHTQTGGSTLTAQQIDNNVVRVAYQALAAVLGGTQSLHTNAKDEALALPTEESARLALRTQQVLAYETGVTGSVDPLAGSYYVEHLTDEIEKLSRQEIEKIDRLGGALAAIANGEMQRAIQESAYAYQQSVEKKEIIVVGVNEFACETLKPKILKHDEAHAQRQIEKLKKLKKNRDALRVLSSLQEVKRAASGSDNLVPPIIAAVKAYATLGEVAATLKDVFGEYHEQGKP